MDKNNLAPSIEFEDNVKVTEFPEQQTQPYPVSNNCQCQIQGLTNDYSQQKCSVEETVMAKTFKSICNHPNALLNLSTHFTILSTFLTTHS